MSKSIHHTKAFLDKKKEAISRTTKVCIVCKKEKSKDEFVTDKKHLDQKHPYCNECKSKYQRERYKKRPSVYYETAKRWVDKNKEKRRAHVMLNKMVSTGKIEKPVICSNCGCSPKRLEAHHHNGYAKEHWLDVVWLCHPCHEKAD